MIYRAPPSSALLHEPLDAFTAVFHRPSGITHLLVAPAPEILAALAPGELTLDALLARLASDYDVADPDTAGDTDGPRAALAARLGELVAAGLVTQRDGAA